LLLIASGLVGWYFLSTPYGIDWNPRFSMLYVGDTYNHRILGYGPSAINGTLIFGENRPGINKTQLNTPRGLFFDSYSNSLIIVNTQVNNVVRYVLDAQEWILLAGSSNGSSGSTSMLFNFPTQVRLDPMGNMYICDHGNHRIQIFYAGQTNGSTIAGITSVGGNNATTLNSPFSVSLDNQLNLYVADSNKHRIQKFLRY